METLFAFNGGKNDGLVLIKPIDDDGMHVRIHKFMAERSAYLAAALHFKNTPVNEPVEISPGLEKNTLLIIFEQLYHGPKYNLYTDLHVEDFIKIINGIKLIQITDGLFEKKMIELCVHAFDTKMRTLPHEDFFRAWVLVSEDVCSEIFGEICYKIFMDEKINRMNFVDIFKQTSETVKKRILNAVFDYPRNIPLQLKHIAKYNCSINGLNYRALLAKKPICKVVDVSDIKRTRTKNQKFVIEINSDQIFIGDREKFLLAMCQIINKMFEIPEEKS